MMKKSCRNALKEALDIYESAALEYRLAADEMMENIDQFWEDDDGERMRKASNAYDDSILTLADAIRFALVTPDEYDVSLRARTERVNTCAGSWANAMSAWSPSTPMMPAMASSG